MNWIYCVAFPGSCCNLNEVQVQIAQGQESLGRIKNSSPLISEYEHHHHHLADVIFNLCITNPPKTFCCRLFLHPSLHLTSFLQSHFLWEELVFLNYCDICNSALNTAEWSLCSTSLLYIFCCIQKHKQTPFITHTHKHTHRCKSILTAEARRYSQRHLWGLFMFIY